METALTYLFLAMATLAHLVFDLHKKYTGRPIRHWLSALIAVTVSILMGFANQVATDVAFWKFVVLSLCVHFALFDPFWNLANHKPFFYNGDPDNPERAWMDKIWDNVSHGMQVLFRVYALIIGEAVYYHWDEIFG